MPSTRSTRLPEIFYSRLFTIPQNNGELRPVLNLSPLNKFLRVIKFKTETVDESDQLASSRDWSTSIDLRDAYFHVAIHPLRQPYLRFVWDNKVYQLRVLPFGLSLAPLITEIIVQFRHDHPCERDTVQSLPVRLVKPGPVKSTMPERSHTDPRFDPKMEFQIKLAKCDLIPSQTFQYLGVFFRHGQLYGATTKSWPYNPCYGVF